MNIPLIFTCFCNKAKNLKLRSSALARGVQMLMCILLQDPTKLGHLCSLETTSVDAPPPVPLMSQSSILSTCFFDALEFFDCEQVCNDGDLSPWCASAILPDNDATQSTNTAQVSMPSLPCDLCGGTWTKCLYLCCQVMQGPGQ